MDELIKDYHMGGVTTSWLQRMALLVLQSDSMDEIRLAWFAHYLDDIDLGAKRCTDLWPPVSVALTFLHSKCPTVKRAVNAILN